MVVLKKSDEWVTTRPAAKAALIWLVPSRVLKRAANPKNRFILIFVQQAGRSRALPAVRGDGKFSGLLKEKARRRTPDRLNFSTTLILPVCTKLKWHRFEFLMWFGLRIVDGFCTAEGG